MRLAFPLAHRRLVFGSVGKAEVGRIPLSQHTAACDAF
jgi:hypothetical protein